jgi:hypothetical protein
MIDFVLEKTKRESLSYIGHSQGTTQMFSALASKHGNLNSKINLFIAMAPAVRLDHVVEPYLKIISTDIDSIYWWFNFLGIHEIFGPGWYLIEKSICSIKKDFCDEFKNATETRKVQWPST